MIVMYFSAVLLLHPVSFTMESVVDLFRKALTTKTNNVLSLIFDHTVPSVKVNRRSHFLDVHLQQVSKYSFTSPDLSFFLLVLVLSVQRDPHSGHVSNLVKHPREARTRVTWAGLPNAGPGSSGPKSFGSNAFFLSDMVVYIVRIVKKFLFLETIEQNHKEPIIWGLIRYRTF